MSNQETIILGIESSCDDTSIAIYQDAQIRSNVVSSQLDHKKYGGVVPELAARKHLDNIPTVLQEALQQADVTIDQISAIAVTAGPGLMGSLIVGINFAKGLSLALDVPLISVDHMRAHILAHFIDESYPNFPFLCLTVSGGHTQIVLVEDYFNMKILGKTLDDAAGEAFDKAGKILGLNYPAGPIIDKLAKEGEIKYDFPIPNMNGYDFSFSGLKTSLLYFLKNQIKTNPDFIRDNLNDICASFQDAIVKSLILKLKKAAREQGIQEIALAGGVSANSHLKIEMTKLASNLNWNLHIPPLKYCTDNAAMIAVSGYYQYLKGDFASLDLEPAPRLKLN